MTIALLCLTDASGVEVSPFGSAGRSAEVHVGSASAIVLLSSDNLGDFDPRLMSRACSDDACIPYQKSCAKTDRGYACTYTTANVPYAGWLRISAPTEASFHLAEMRLSIFNVEGGKPVPLGKFDVVTDQPVPFCRHGGRGPQCPSANGS